MSTIVHFFNGSDEASENHYYEKEYRDDIIVEIDGKFYETYFFTQSSLEYEMRQDGFFSMPGLIILDEISNDKILNSIINLNKIGYFARYHSYSENPINNRFIQKWYENELDNYKEDKLSSIKLS